MAITKKILAMLLVTATLVGVMAIPTSAATAKVPLNEVYLGYNASGSLNLTNYSVSADLSLSRRPGNIIVPIYSLEITGTVTYSLPYNRETT